MLNCYFSAPGVLYVLVRKAKSPPRIQPVYRSRLSTTEEVRGFLQKAKMGVGTADPELPAEFCEAMLENEAALSVLVGMLVKIWCSGRAEKTGDRADFFSRLGHERWGFFLGLAMWLLVWFSLALAWVLPTSLMRPLVCQQTDTCNSCQ